MDDKKLFLLYRDMSFEDIERVKRTQSKAAIRDMLDDKLQVYEYEEGIRAQILSNFHLNNFIYCLERNMSTEKISTFVSLMKDVLWKGIQEGINKEHIFEVFKSQLLRHSVDRSPFSICVFDEKDVIDLTHFFFTRFLITYRLYQFVYSSKKKYHVKLYQPQFLTPDESPGFLVEHCVNDLNGLPHYLQGVLSLDSPQ